jgi:hypothetical protein
MKPKRFVAFKPFIHSKGRIEDEIGRAQVTLLVNILFSVISCPGIVEKSKEICEEHKPDNDAK